MEFNRALPADADPSVSDESLRQAFAYTNAEPIRFSCTTSCCNKIRENSELVDPGYYLNGGPLCAHLRLTCASPHEHDVEAYADSLVPGCIVYAPRTENQFWPAIVDFSPEKDSHFVIFRIGGSQCCVPYAYYLSFIPDWSGEVFRGWFTVDYIVPFDTLVNKRVSLEVNINDPHFDSAFERANRYYARDLKTRLERFSIVCQTLLTKSRRVRNLQSPTKSIKGMMADQARKLSQGIVRRLGSSNYQRVEGGENISLGSLGSSLASSSTSSSETGAGGLAGLLIRKLTFTPQNVVRGMRGRDGDFSFLTLGDLAHEQDHVHPALGSSFESKMSSAEEAPSEPEASSAQETPSQPSTLEVPRSSPKQRTSSEPGASSDQVTPSSTGTLSEPGTPARKQPLNPRADVAVISTFVNPTEHWRSVCHEVYKRGVIQAIIKCDLHEVRTYAADEPL